MLNIFRSNYAFINALLVLYGAAMGAIAYLGGVDANHYNSGALSPWLNDFSDGFRIIIATGLLIVQAFVLNKIFNAAPFPKKATTIPGLLFLSACLIDSRIFYLQGDHVFFTLCILGLFVLNGVMRNSPAREQVFIYALLLGVGAIFYTPAAPILLVAWLVLIVFRPFVWREYVVAIMAFWLAPLFLLFVQLFRDKGALKLLGDSYQQNLLPDQNQTELWYLIVVFTGIFLILGMRYLLKNYVTSTVRKKKLTRVNFLSFLLISGVMTGAVFMRYPGNWQLAATMLFAFVSSFYFMDKQKRPVIQSLLFYIWMGLLIVRTLVKF